MMLTLVANVDCEHSGPSLMPPAGGMPRGNETTFSISGLIGADTPTTPSLPLAGAGANIFGGSGSWNQRSGTLTLKVAVGQRVSAGVAILVNFSLTNSMRGQQSPRLFTYVAGTCARYNGSLSLPRRYIDVDLDTVLAEVGSVVGDAAPLLIRSPSFAVRKIAQSNPSAGGANTMTLSLAANVDLDSTTLLTIHGLTPTATPSSPRVLLAGGYSVDPSAPSGVGSYAFYGDWTSNDMGLPPLFVVRQVGQRGHKDLIGLSQPVHLYHSSGSTAGICSCSAGGGVVSGVVSGAAWAGSAGAELRAGLEL